MRRSLPPGSDSTARSCGRGHPRTHSGRGRRASAGRRICEEGAGDVRHQPRPAHHRRGPDRHRSHRLVVRVPARGPDGRHHSRHRDVRQGRRRRIPHGRHDLIRRQAVRAVHAGIPRLHLRGQSLGRGGGPRHAGHHRERASVENAEERGEQLRQGIMHPATRCSPPCAAAVCSTPSSCPTAARMRR